MAQELHSLTLPITSGGTTTPTEFSVDYLARKDGYYESMAAGTADNLVDRKGDGTSQEFTFRTSCGSDSISDDGHGIIKSIHGNTIVWNQLVNIPTASKTTHGLTFTRTSSACFTVSGTWDGGYISYTLSYSATMIQNHKYIALSNVPTSIYCMGSAISTKYWTPNSIGTYTGSSGVGALSLEGQANYPSGSYYVMLIDLTQMFGAGNEPSTVAEFKAMFPLNYYAYDAGSLLSFNGTGIKTVGFNQWDEEWESGAYNVTNGTKEARADTIRSKNFIPIFPSTQYYCHRNSAVYEGNVRPLFYDINKNFINSPGGQNDVVFTTPANAYYMTFYVVGTSYSGGININLSWSGYRNGEYEEHWEETKALPISTYFTDGMKSAGSVYDELTPNKAVKRIGVVDLGSLTWTRDTSYGTSAIFYATIPNMSYTRSVVMIMAKYSCFGSVTRSAFSNGAQDKSYAQNTTNAFILVRDDAYTSTTDFKAAMSGVYLYYELATPVETTIEPPLNLTYKVADFGTEQLLPENDDEPTTSPFNGVIKYSDDFTRMLANLPKNYQSQSSMDSLLSALGTACNGTFTKTWDSSNNKWTFTFTANA